MVALAAGLRIAMATGGLWLDEAWSAMLAREAIDPVGIFLHLNHDNNHHLNTLWLQAVGLDAPPLVQRALAIVSSVLSVAVAAAIGARRGSATALITATLFAVSPVFVTYGAEARGYAPMILALLVAILLVDRWRAGENGPPRNALAACFGLGMLAQPTTIFGFVAIAGWVAIDSWQRERSWTAVVEAADALVPGFIALLAVLVIILTMPLVDGEGLQIGGFEYFAWDAYRGALVRLAAHLVAAPLVALWPIALLPALFVTAWLLGVGRMTLYLLAIIAFPLAIGVVQPANPGHSRYYLLAAIGLLLMLGETIARAIARGRIWRLGGAAALIGIVTANLWVDAVMIDDQRGRPDAPIAIIAREAPAGADLLIERAGSRAVYQVAAAQRGYRLHLMFNGCRPAAYLVTNRFRSQAFDDLSTYCGMRWERIAQRRAKGMADDGWQLYRRAG